MIRNRFEFRQKLITKLRELVDLINRETLAIKDLESWIKVKELKAELRGLERAIDILDEWERSALE